MLIMLRAFLVAQTVKNLPAMFDPWIGKIKYNIYTPWAGLHACLLSRFSRVRLFQTLWTVAHQAPLSMGFPRQEYWSGLPLPFPGDLPDPGVEPRFPHCRQIVYHLSHQGSLIHCEIITTISLLTIHHRTTLFIVSATFQYTIKYYWL